MNKKLIFIVSVLLVMVSVSVQKVSSLSRFEKKIYGKWMVGEPGVGTCLIFGNRGYVVVTTVNRAYKYTVKKNRIVIYNWYPTRNDELFKNKSRHLVMQIIDFKENEILYRDLNPYDSEINKMKKVSSLIETIKRLKESGLNNLHDYLNTK